MKIFLFKGNLLVSKYILLKYALRNNYTMTISHILKQYLRFNVVLVITICHCTSSCVTTGTGKLVQKGPMTEDLELKVLKQTGLSGTVIGGLAGGAAGFGLGLLLVTVESAAGVQRSDQERARIVAATTMAGAAAGGIFGYNKGQQKGRQVVASAKEKNQLSSMVKGAREYNARMAAENQSLRKRVAIAKTSKDKKQLATLKKEAEANLADANARLKTRQKALEKTQPDFRSGYASTLPVLKQEKAKLESTIKNIAATESVISL